MSMIGSVRDACDGYKKDGQIKHSCIYTSVRVMAYLGYGMDRRRDRGRVDRVKRNIIIQTERVLLWACTAPNNGVYTANGTSSRVCKRTATLITRPSVSKTTFTSKRNPSTKKVTGPDWLKMTSASGRCMASSINISPEGGWVQGRTMTSTKSTKPETDSSHRTPSHSEFAVQLFSMSGIFVSLFIFSARSTRSLHMHSLLLRGTAMLGTNGTRMSPSSAYAW